MTRLAVLGLGAMGARMAARLLAAGHAVTVWNRDPARAAPLVAAGAVLAPTPRAAAADAGIVLAMVRDDPASAAVWTDPATGALAGMATGAVAVDCSTLTPAHVRRMADVAAGRGVAFLDAPVAGSRPQAEAGQLVFMAGGAADDLARVEPVLRAMGAAVHHAGPVGAGATVKLAVNAMLAVQVAALAELLGFLRQGGVDPARAVEIVGATSVASPAAKAAAGAMLAGAFEPQFPIDLAAKDMGYVIATAGARGAPAPVATTVRDVLDGAVRQGLGPANLPALAGLYG